MHRRLTLARNGEFVLANRKAIRACADLSDGGLALAVFEMAEGAGLGVKIDGSETGFLFGEDQARYLLAVAQGQLAGLQAAAKAAGVTLSLVGQFDGDQVLFGEDGAPMADLSALYRSAFASTVGV